MPAGQTSQLAAGLATDSLGTQQIPTLAPAEDAIRTLSASNGFRLTAGKLVATANARVVTSPLVAEYGVSDRLTIGLVVPLVQTRTTLFVALNPDTGRANVGPNPARFASDALSANASVVGQFRTAAATLQSRLTSCQANPTQPQCAPIVGHESAAQALIQSSNAFAGAIESLYGTSAATPGQLFVPLSGTAAQTAISARIAQFDTSYHAYLGASAISGTPAAAEGPAALRQLQQLVSGDELGIGRDTLSSTERTSIGDVSLAATYQLLNSFADSLAPRRMRVVVNGAVRFATGQPPAPNRLFDIGTGAGQMGVDVGAAADVQLGRRFLLTGVGQYTVNLGSVDVARVANPANAPVPLTLSGSGTYSAGNVLSVLAIPRYRLAPELAINALYALRHTGADRFTTTTAFDLFPGPNVADAQRGAAGATEQQVGFGFSYSTVLEHDRAPGRLPLELSFLHIETIRASGGPVAKLFRDQVEARVYIARRR